MKEQDEKKAYTTPTVEQLGAVNELTLGSRDDHDSWGGNNGHNQP
jgi:hypothetical protein